MIPLEGIREIVWTDHVPQEEISSTFLAAALPPHANLRLLSWVKDLHDQVPMTIPRLLSPTNSSHTRGNFHPVPQFHKHSAFLVL